MEQTITIKLTTIAAKELYYQLSYICSAHPACKDCPFKPLEQCVFMQLSNQDLSTKINKEG